MFNVKKKKNFKKLVAKFGYIKLKNKFSLANLNLSEQAQKLGIIKNAVFFILTRVLFTAALVFEPFLQSSHKSLNLNNNSEFILY